MSAPDPRDGNEPAPGEPTTDKVKGIFANIAGTYDLVNIVASLGIDRLWRRRAVKMAGLGGDSRVLDLAAGTGDLTLAIAKQARPAHVVSTDFVPEMLAVGERKAARYTGPTEIEFARADAQDLQFADETFDAVTIGFGVRNLPDRAANFAEVLRVLRPHGRYVILEFSRPRIAFVRSLYHVYLQRVVPFLGGLLAKDRESYQYLNDSIRAFPEQTELGAELEDAGFGPVSWKDLTLGIVAVHVAVKPG